jgi:phosphotriesterase-related protein
MVHTATGPVAPEDLGPTLMHEHIFILNPEIHINYPEAWGDEEQRIQEAADRLNELYESGIRTVVDLTAIGLGRNVGRIAQVARRTPLRIVVAAGIYTYADLPFAFQMRGPGTVLGGEEFLVNLFLRDIRDGIAGTGVHAGILKCATDKQGLTKDVERVLRAVAKAHRASGVPISTHTHARSRSGLDQQRIFLEEGVDLGRVVIGHSGDTTDFDYLEELIRNGSYLGMDRFGIGTILKFEDRVRVVAEMCRRGHASRMVLSHDAHCFNDWLPEEDWRRLLPDWNYLHIHKDVLPALRASGVTEEQIDTMLTGNPRRIFANCDPY